MNEGLEIFKFPNGEMGVKFTPISNEVELFFDIKSSDDIITLLLAIDAVNAAECLIKKIVIPCLPYQRQDRRCASGEAFSLLVLLKAINSASECHLEIESYDIHGKIPGVHGIRVRNVNPLGYFNPEHLNGVECIVSPDAGAVERAGNFSKDTGSILIELDKVRVNGEVKSIAFKDNPFEASKISGKKLLIVDDLCDGGATFIHSAKLLKSVGAKSVDLVVTHGLFTKGFDVFKGHIDNVYWFNYEGKFYNKKEIA